MALEERGAQGGGVGEGAVVGDGQPVRVVGVQGLRFRAQRLGARRRVPVSNRTNKEARKRERCLGF